MAISGFGRGKEQGATRTPSQVPASANLTAFIDQGSHFEGKLSFKDTVRIDGHFQGEITSENTLIVGESGDVEATIRSSAVVVSGSVMGDIFASRQVTLHKTAHVEGNIDTESLIVHEGAAFNGKVTMNRKDARGKGVAPLKAIQGGTPKADPAKAKVGT